MSFNVAKNFPVTAHREIKVYATHPFFDFHFIPFDTEHQNIDALNDFPMDGEAFSPYFDWTDFRLRKSPKIIVCVLLS